MKKSQKKIKERFETLSQHLNEKQRRLFLAVEAKSIGYVGIEEVSKVTGISKKTIIKGKTELLDSNTSKIRKSGGGRKSKEEKYPDLKAKIKNLVEASTRGDPESLLLWTSKSSRISAELKKIDYNVSHVTILNILEALGYSCKQIRKQLKAQRNILIAMISLNI